MALKKKERVLTPEEFKAKQKRDFAPCWINSEVIFGANLFPIDESFTKKITILFLLDAADFTTERTVELLMQWNQKYTKLHWDGVLVFEQKYAFLKNPKFFERFKNRKIFLDTFGTLFERFGSGKEPVAVVLRNGELVFSVPLLPDFAECSLLLEQKFQSILREGNAGLPLPKPERVSKKNAPMEQQNVSPENVTTFGEWNGSNTLLVTEKNGSILSIPFQGKHLRLIGMAHPNARDPIKVSITFNEKSLMTNMQTSIINEDNTGATSVELNKISGIYDIIQSENPLSGIVKLTFLNVDDNGAVFYEFKIAS